MTTIVLNNAVRAYVHIAFRAVQAACDGRITAQEANQVCFECQAGLEKLGYAFEVCKKVGVRAKRIA